jgi:hypothetical protein
VKWGEFGSGLFMCGLEEDQARWTGHSAATGWRREMNSHHLSPEDGGSMLL